MFLSSGRITGIEDLFKLLLFTSRWSGLASPFSDISLVPLLTDARHNLSISPHKEVA